MCVKYLSNVCTHLSFHDILEQNQAWFVLEKLREISLYSEGTIDESRGSDEKCTVAFV